MGYENSRGGSFSREDRGPQEKHPAKCSDCGADCTVPFKPTPGKAVRCGACHKKFKGY